MIPKLINLLSYKTLFDDQIELALAEKEKSPFARAIKVFNTHINSVWKTKVEIRIQSENLAKMESKKP